jgi:hypothetical protein
MTLGELQSAALDIDTRTISVEFYRVQHTDENREAAIRPCAGGPNNDSSLPLS